MRPQDNSVSSYSKFELPPMSVWTVRLECHSKQLQAAGSEHSLQPSLGVWLILELGPWKWEDSLQLVGETDKKT